MTQTVPPQLATALRELTRLIKAVQYYPKGHPALNEAAGGARNAFLPLLQSGDNLTCTVRKEGFFFGDQPVGKANQVLQKLATFLFTRLVKHLVILPDLTHEDLIIFARALTTDPAEIRRQGGIKEMLLRHQLTTIWVNETDLALILVQKEEIESARGDELGGYGEEGDEFDPQGMMQGAGPEQAPLSIKEILSQLAQAQNDEQFSRLLQQLIPLVLVNRTPQGRMQVLQALAQLCQWSADRTQKPPRREAAQQTLQQICDPASIEFLLSFLCERELAEKYRNLLVSILAFLKQRTTARVMEKLAHEGDAGNRKHLASTLVRQGTEATPTLIEYLQDDRWYVVRNAATILGGICDPGTARHLNSLLHHEDIRVCREAIRALTRIGGSNAVQILLDAVDDEDEEISRQALLSLGIIGDASAVPKLSRIVNKVDIFLKQWGQTRDAIRALGEIGAPEAVPALSRVLRRRRIFKRRPFDELRAAAAQALGEIGDPAAEPLLKKASRDRSANVVRQANLALKYLQREHEPGTA